MAFCPVAFCLSGLLSCGLLSSGLLSRCLLSQWPFVLWPFVQWPFVPWPFVGEPSEALPVLKSFHAKIAVNHFDSIQMLYAWFLQWILFCSSCFLTHNSQHAVSRIIASYHRRRPSVCPSNRMSVSLPAFVLVLRQFESRQQSVVVTCKQYQHSLVFGR